MITVPALLQKYMYDLTYIVNPNLSGEEVAGLKKGIKDLVIGKDGRIETEIPETKKRLAYPINKLTNGYYISFDFEIDPENLPEIDKKLRLENNILR